MLPMARARYKLTHLIQILLGKLLKKVFCHHKTVKTINQLLPSQNHENLNSNPPCVEVPIATALTNTSCPALYSAAPACHSRHSNLSTFSRSDWRKKRSDESPAHRHFKPPNTPTQDLGCQWHESIWKREVVLE